MNTLLATVLAATVLANGEHFIANSQGTYVDPKGHTLEVTSKTMRFDGKPTVGVMGEMHYARVPETEWADYVQKMKDGGLTMIATYVFWIHHEEQEGVFNWEGQRNLSKFLSVCEEKGMPVVLRLGPWCHGECVDGGFPSWLLSGHGRLRSTDRLYLDAVRKFWTETFKQVDGHLFKQGGSVIGCQLENECGGPWPYMMALKNMAREIGFDVPFYTRTGWPKMHGRVEYGEILPLFGDYADGFWDRSDRMSPKSYAEAFKFRATRTSANIATEQIKASELGKDDPTATQYPYLTCELGGGMASSYHRRVVTFPMDAFAMAVVKLGSGSNLLGYYMYAGGTNPNRPKEGVFFNERQATKFTNHNDLPPFSYEFNAPIGEFGQLNPHWYMLKSLHAFCAKYGAELALEEPVIVSQTEARRGRFVFHCDYGRPNHLDGNAWVGIEENGKLVKLVDGREELAKAETACAAAKRTTTSVAFKKIKEAGQPREVKPGARGVAEQPAESDWSEAAVYELMFTEPLNTSTSQILNIHYTGDCARLYIDDVPVADDFYKGLPMQVGLWRLPKGKLTLRILPWGDSPLIYVQSPYRPSEKGEKLLKVTL